MNFRPLPILSALLCLVPFARAEDNPTSIAFSDPSQPGRLIVTMVHGGVSIRGDDVATVTVHSSARGGPNGQTRPDGLRVISSSTSFSLTEQDNVVSLEYGTHNWGEPADFDIVVPHHTHLDIEVRLGGQITVAEVAGDVSVKNLNGEVSLQNLSGGAIVESMNGEVSASFSKLLADKALSFTSMNGKIDLRLPADARANVRFRSQNGTILTDFGDDVLVTTTTAGRAFAPSLDEELVEVATSIAQEAAEVAREIAQEVRVAVRNSWDGQAPAAPEAPRAPRAPRAPSIPPMAGGKVISGTLNGGGVDLQIATMNGDIIVRQRTD